MARILSRFDTADIEALVTLGNSRGPTRAYLADVLEQRLRLILDRYLLRRAPGRCANRIERRSLRDRFCRRRLCAPSRLPLCADVATRQRSEPAVARRFPRKDCISLPHAPVAANTPDDEARYVVVRITRRVSLPLPFTSTISGPHAASAWSDSKDRRP